MDRSLQLRGWILEEFFMRTSLPLLALCLASLLAPAGARAAVTFAGIDGFSSTVMQEGQSSFSGLGLRTRITSDRLMTGFSIMPTVEWWRSSANIQPFNIRTSRNDAALGADLRYDIHTKSMKPYVGVGFFAHFLSTSVDAPQLGLDHASDALIKGGLAALGGVQFGLAGKVDNFLELKYHHLPGYRQVKLNWGLAYNF
jgi:hypothetical protein